MVWGTAASATDKRPLGPPAQSRALVPSSSLLATWKQACNVHVDTPPTPPHEYVSTLRDANIQRTPIHQQPNCSHLSTPVCGQGSARGSQITYGCNRLSFSAPAQLAVWRKQVQGNWEARLLQSQGGEPGRRRGNRELFTAHFPPTGSLWGTEERVMGGGDIYRFPSSFWPLPILEFRKVAK